MIDTLPKMFEAQALHYLKKYLGTYVEGVDEHSLRISVWQGDVVLKKIGRASCRERV